MFSKYSDYEVFGTVQARRAPGAVLVDSDNKCIYVYRSAGEAVCAWARWFDCWQGLEMVVFEK